MKRKRQRRVIQRLMKDEARKIETAERKYRLEARRKAELARETHRRAATEGAA